MQLKDFWEETETDDTGGLVFIFEKCKKWNQ